MTPDTEPKKLSPEEQKKLDSRLSEAAMRGETGTIKTLLTAGADVHARDDWALCLAAWKGHAETVQVLLEAGANLNYVPLFSAVSGGHKATVQLLAKHMFAPDSWRGKTLEEIKAKAESLYHMIEPCGATPEHLLKTAKILRDCALDCWFLVRPAPPPEFKISPLPAQPRPV